MKIKGLLHGGIVRAKEFQFLVLLWCFINGCFGDTAGHWYLVVDELPGVG
jgi:hypothetical protein